MVLESRDGHEIYKKKIFLFDDYSFACGAFRGERNIRVSAAFCRKILTFEFGVRWSQAVFVLQAAAASFQSQSRDEDEGDSCEQVAVDVQFLDQQESWQEGQQKRECSETKQEFGAEAFAVALEGCGEVVFEDKQVQCVQHEKSGDDE